MKDEYNFMVIITEITPDFLKVNKLITEYITKRENEKRIVQGNVMSKFATCESRPIAS